MNSSRFNYSQIFIILLLPVIALLFGLNSSYADEQPTATGGDFTVVAKIPGVNAIDIDPGALVGADFSAAADSGTLTANSFLVHGALSGTYSGTFDFTSPSSVRFTASEAFKPGEIIEVTASSAIKSGVGDALSPPQTWRFTVGVGQETGTGSARFHAKPNPDGGWEAIDAALGDLDGDGDLDALVMSKESDAAGRHGQVWINDGNANFTNNGQALPLKVGESISLGDYDSDGDLDAIAGGRSFTAQLWQNNGQAEFSAVMSTPNTTGNVRASGDFDNDGDIDLFIAGTYTGRFWFNDGAAQFSAGSQELGRPDSYMYGVAYGDLDGDQDLDLILDDGRDNNGDFGVRIYKNNGTGIFTPQEPRLEVPSTAAIINIGDLDGDADLDLFILGLVWTNDGQGKFTLWDDTNYGNPVEAADIGDLNGDGHLDILMTGDSWLWVLLNDSQGRFSKTSQRTGQYYTKSLKLGDLDDDGDLDAFDTQSDDGRRGIWLNRNQPQAPTFWVDDTDPQANDTAVAQESLIKAQFNQPVKAASLQADSFLVRGDHSSIIFGDIASQNKQATLTPEAPFMAGEQVVATLTEGVMSTQEDALQGYSWQFTAANTRGTGRLIFTQAMSHPDDSQIALADLDADGDVDALIAECDPSDPLNASPAVVWLNSGQALFSKGDKLAGGCNLGLDLGDLDGDGAVDVFMAGFEGNQVWLNNGIGDFSKLGESFGGVVNYPVTLGDLDNDGDLDSLVITAGGVNHGVIWFNNGQGQFFDSGQLFPVYDERTLALGDLDGDGDTDAIIGARVWINDGLGFFDEGARFTDLSQLNQVNLADFDGDGDLDALFSATYHSGLWKNNGAAKFNRTDELQGGRISAAVGDFDADGDMDVLLDGKSLYVNDGSGKFQGLPPGIGFGRTGSIALADLNGDGALDAFLGNKDGSENSVWLNVPERAFLPIVFGK